MLADLFVGHNDIHIIIKLVFNCQGAEYKIKHCM